MREFGGTFQGPNLWTVCIEGEYHNEGIKNISRKIIEENYQNLEKEMPMKVHQVDQSIK